MRLLLLIPALLYACLVSAQDGMLNERAAKEAVYRIVRHSGLQPVFTVRENTGIPTAVAYIKGKERVIAYNPAFMARVMDSTCTNWSAISVLAHEIGHHLLGHTLDPGNVHTGDELACDIYSGFILHAMGATKEEALAAMDVAGNPHGTENHPPKHARLNAIQQGWNTTSKEPKYRLVWNDKHYFVDGRNMIWKRSATGIERIVGSMSNYARP